MINVSWQLKYILICTNICWYIQNFYAFSVLLRRVSEQSDENKMSARNLGIIFGPTLIRPRETDATLSLSSLVDYPYQARMIELLITHYEKIFDTAQEHSSAATESDENSFCTKSILSVEDKQASQDRKGGFFVAMKEVSFC